MTEQNEKPKRYRPNSYMVEAGLLTENNYVLYSEYESLKQENEKLREALSFYADFNNWFGEFKNKGNMNFPNIDKSDWEQFQSTVGGKRARHALAENKGNE